MSMPGPNQYFFVQLYKGKIQDLQKYVTWGPFYAFTFYICLCIFMIYSNINSEPTTGTTYYSVVYYITIYDYQKSNQINQSKMLFNSIITSIPKHSAILKKTAAHFSVQYKIMYSILKSYLTPSPADGYLLH